MLIYSMFYIHTHIGMWVIHVYACLQVIWEGPVETQNHNMMEWLSAILLEALGLQKVQQRCDENDISYLYTFECLILLLRSLEKQRELICEFIPLLFPPFFSLLFVKSRPLFVCLWLGRWWRTEAQLCWVYLQPPSPSSPSPLFGMKAGVWPVYIELMGGALHVERCSVNGSVCFITGSSWHCGGGLHLLSWGLRHKNSSYSKSLECCRVFHRR